MIGPLNEIWCGIHIFMRNVLLCCFIFTSDSIIVLRYLFVFKWTRISVFDDNIMALFLQMSIFALSFWVALVKMISVGKMPLNYYMCIGKYPYDHETGYSGTSSVNKYNTTALLVLVSFLLQFTMADSNICK